MSQALRLRRLAASVLLVLAGLLFPLAITAGWARNTLYDSATFSSRAVEILNSSAVREELSHRLTEQLALSGNSEAVNFRPGLELAIDAAVDTESFRSIFRTAVRRTHQAVLAGQRAGSGLNLADSASVITSTVQLSRPSSSGGNSANGLGNSLSDVTQRLGKLGIWKLDDTISSIAIVALVGALVAAAGAVALASDRRRGCRRIGWVLVVDGAVLVAALQVVQWWAGRRVADSRLSGAVTGAISHGTADLRNVGLWVAGYGLVIVAAAGHGATLTPAVVARRARAWAERRRRSSIGTVALGALVLLAGVLLVQDPTGNLRVLVVVAGLWLSYLGVSELLRVVRSMPAPAAVGSRWLRSAIVVGTVVALLAGLSVGLVASSGRAARRADVAGPQRCNGSASLCDLHLDQVMFPGTHNSMSSSLYPGYLFGEQIGTIKRQLDSGVRALLIDTHYGVPSTMRLPGVPESLVLTDRAAELRQTTGETVDPELADRAARLAARAPAAASARRGIYLCHNYCELGAVPFAGALADLKTFLDANPNEVVTTIIQDGTKPADTAAAIEAAGLGDRLVTLQKGQPLPTLGELIDTRRTLLVFAEEGGPGAPAWYQPAYRWFQETPFSFKSAGDFTCRPNRGSTSNPLLLVNHWVTESPPDPAAAARVNSPDALKRRIETCIAQRAVLPNVVAVDFSEKGKLVATLHAINRAKVREVTKDKSRVRPGQEVATGPQKELPAVAAPPAPKITVGRSRPVPAGSAITSLTGGDPQRFCAQLPTAVRDIVAWAQTILGDAPGGAGITDFVYGPLLERSVGGYVDSAPVEVAERARPLLARARAAVAELRILGLDQAAISRLADEASATLGTLDSPDGVTVRDRLASTLQRRIRPTRLSNAAVVFTAGQRDPATILDLGYVSDSVSQAAGYDCPDILVTI